jgi:hypothetical protein
MITATATVPRSRPQSYLEFHALEALPCGCVSAEYRARPWDLPVVALEAKGPYCRFGDHETGQILQLGEPVTIGLDDDE